VTLISVPAEPPAAVAVPAPSAPPLWRDDFASFKHKPKHYEGDPEAWVLNPAEFAASYDAPSKQLRCTVTSPAGYASMSRLLPYAPEHRAYRGATIGRPDGRPFINPTTSHLLASTDQIGRQVRTDADVSNMGQRGKGVRGERDPSQLGRQAVTLVASPS
jgi:hypothetical protein